MLKTLIYLFTLVGIVFFEMSVYAGDTSAPSQPGNIQFNEVSSTSLSFSWVVSSDNVAVTQYKIKLNDVVMGFSKTNKFILNSLKADTFYQIKIYAKDAAGNAVNSAKDAAGNAVDATKDAANDAADKAKDAAGSAADKVKDAVKH